MRTLIVDDQPENRHVLQRMLGHFGECVMASDGNEALAELIKSWDEQRTFDLICLDIMMPGMDGQEALKNIRTMESARNIRNQQRVKIFMTTAIRDASAVSSAYCDDCTAYLPKPIEYHLLLGNLIHLGLISTAEAAKKRTTT